MSNATALGRIDNFSDDFSTQQSFENGQKFGDFISLVGGVIETGVGLFGEGFGALTTPFGLGFGVIAVSTAVVIHGAAVTVVSHQHLMNDAEGASSEANGDYDELPQFEKMKQGNNKKVNEQFAAVMEKYGIKFPSKKWDEAHALISGKGLQGKKGIEDYLNKEEFFKK